MVNLSQCAQIREKYVVKYSQCLLEMLGLQDNQNPQSNRSKKAQVNTCQKRERCWSMQNIKSPCLLCTCELFLLFQIRCDGWVCAKWAPMMPLFTCVSWGGFSHMWGRFGQTCKYDFSSLFSNENNGSLLQRSLLSILFFKDISLVPVVPKIIVGIYTCCPKPDRFFGRWSYNE